MPAVKLSRWQLTALLVAAVLPTALLVVPASTAQNAGNNFWASLTIAWLTVVVIGYLFTAPGCLRWIWQLLGRENRGGGGPGPVVVNLGLVLYFILSSGILLREFVDLMGTIYLRQTPVWLVAAALLVVVDYGLRVGLGPLARINSLAVLSIMVTIVLVAAVNLRALDQEFLQPQYSRWPGLLLGALVPLGWLSETLLFALLLGQHLADAGQLRSAALLALLLDYLALLLVNIASLGLFGAEVCARMIYPAFNLIRETRLESLSFFERTDALFMGVWVLGMAFKLAVFMYCGKVCLLRACGLTDYRFCLLPCAVLVLGLALYGWENISALLQFSSLTVPPYLLFYNVVFLLAVYLLSRLSEKKPEG
ncbi:MAG: GerAB/ArcD/ProY family transporter [Desulfurispora sp.]|uniref:GerAB/ArcD/ProY family transporter n=1 Tax=Desulfurispora sp. TaxID=3014275 RepID=UPI00404B4858